MDDLGCPKSWAGNPTAGAPVCTWGNSLPSLLSPNSTMSWSIPGFKDIFLLLGPDLKIISYSSAFIHRHLHWHLQSQTCIYTPTHTHTLTHTYYPEIGLLATWFGLNAVENASWPYQLVTCFSKIPPLIIYPFGNPQLRIKCLWSRQHTIRLSSNILAGSHFAQGTSPSLTGRLLILRSDLAFSSCSLFPQTNKGG